MWAQHAGGGVEMLAFAPDGRTLYTADTTKTVAAWDTVARTGRKLFTREESGPWGMFCAAGGRFLVVRGHTPLIWDCHAGAEHARLGVTASEAFAPGHYMLRPVPGDDGLLLVNRGRNLAMRVWDVAARAFGPDPGWWPRVEPLSWFDVSPDGRVAALLSSTTLTLAGLLTGETLGEVQMPRFGGRVVFAPDGRTVAVLAHPNLWLWNLTTAPVLVEGVLITRARLGALQVFAFHPTAPVFLALNPDGLPTLFDRDTHRPIRTLDFELGQHANCAAFSPDGLTCAVGGSKKRFVVFDVDV